MHQSNHPKSRSGPLATHFLGLSLAWVLIVGGLMALDLAQIRRTQRDMARKEALATFNKDQAFRYWAASHGGVYVPTNERTPANPYLKDVPDRDIQTPNGKSLTLMNPAYMMRQLMQDYAEFYGICGHLTSLKPFRPETAPDEWERSALLEFENGIQEVSEFTYLGSAPYLRLMRPLYATEDCLRCHASQGYKPGDVRGGTSISVPMAPYLAVMQREMTVHAISFGILLLLGLVGIGMVGRILMREMRDRDKAELELQRARDVLEAQTAALSTANAQLKQSNEALGDFALVASHDLQEPLRKIRKFGNLLRSKCADCPNEETRDYSQRMQNAASRMQALIQSLLTYSRLQSHGELFRAVDLDKLIHEVVADLEVRIHETRGIVNVEDLPVVWADQHQMRQLFQNLIGNALKYHRSGERPVVKVGSKQRSDGFCEVFVEDNGIGVDEKDLKRIFMPFQRLHGRNEYEGTGMGLAICKRIAERHGGSITASSILGQGSTFIVSLPLAKGQIGDTASESFAPDRDAS